MDRARGIFELAALLASEADRRSAGRSAAALSAWETAVAAGAKESTTRICRERAILAKPDSVDWPAAAAIAGADEPVFAAPPDTADVLIGMGKMRLSRGALQPALLAFSRAETETHVAGKKDLARLYRAQTMIALEQPASALPMLDSLMKSTDPRIARKSRGR